MIYVILGKSKKIDKALKIDAFSWEVETVRSLIESSSLFGGQDDNSIILDTISDNTEQWQELLGMIEAMQSSSKNFYVLERDLNKDDLESFKNLGTKVEDYREKPSKRWPASTQKYNPFAIADAFGLRSAKDTWVEYMKAREYGAESEELHARLWSKLRDMRAVSMGESATSLSIHPFVYSKAKKDLEKWSTADMEKTLASLVNIYHEARMGREELDVSLEKLILAI